MSKEKKIKIFVDAHCIDAGFQGTRTFIRGLYSSLLQHEAFDIYFGTQKADCLRAVFPNLEPGRIIIYKKRDPAILRFIFDIPAILKNNEFDFAHFQYLCPPQVKNCQYVLTMHDILFNDFKSLFSWKYRLSRNFLFGRSFQKAAIKTTVSAYSGKRISRYYHVPPEQVHIIPNGVSCSFGANLTKVHACELISKKYSIRNFILYVSRIEPRKNHLLLLDKFLELKLFRQNISLVFIGFQSIHVPRLRERIDSLTTEQKPFFHWIGEVSQDDLEAFYRSCRLFVYPSKAEGFGIPPLEAAVCRVPVLCSDATAMKDFSFFKPFTFDPGNANEFENKLKTMIDSALPACQLDKIAETVLEKYSWENSAAAFSKLLLQNYHP